MATQSMLIQNVSGVDSNVGFFFGGWSNIIENNLSVVQVGWYAQGENVQNGRVTNIDILNQTITLENSQRFKSGRSYTFTSFLINYYTPCFKIDSKICTLTNNKEEYIPIQNIKSGDLIKTLNNGYVKVETIGKSKIYNHDNNIRYSHRLFKYSKKNNTKLFEDLYLTGGHSVLVDNLTEEEKNSTNKYMGFLPLTDNKYRLLTFLNINAEPYLSSGVFTVYHIALENINKEGNYGIFANGIIVESCSINYIKSYMTII